MDQFQAIVGVISLTMGVSWASGVNLYAALLMLGIGGATGNIDLPPAMETLENPLVIMAAGVMYFAEFFADKIPGLDSTWDALHTFIRIPAGALLAASAVGDVTPAVEIAAGILGGGMAATSHAAKAGTRLAINTSPEPFTNWGMSITEDIAVIGGLWAALNHPWIFLGLLAVFIALTIWLLPKIWRGIRFLFNKLASLFGKREPATLAPDIPQPASAVSGTTSAAAVASTAPGAITPPLTPEPAAKTSPATARLLELRQLLDAGAITEDEYNTLKAKALQQL
ncbi:MAG: DUF4126 family protein [Pseudomonadales bacterium]|nr:DUF4126 family protein [Pseudomonadales bacterium]